MHEKPREEISYKSLYPGLSVTKALTLKNPIYKHHDVDVLETKKRKSSRQKIKDDLNAIEYSANDQDTDFISRYLQNNKDFKMKYECIAVDLYELIMDRIFKEWRYEQLTLIRNYYLKNCKEKDVYLKCDICTFYQNTESNIILKCYGCNISVHQECYGVPNLEKYTEIENVIQYFDFLNFLWFCRKCLFFKELSPKCKYCDIEGNAFKPIYGSKRWGHVLCVKFIDMLSFSNLVFLEPIEEIKNDEMNSKNNLNGACFLCTNKKGKVIKCFYKECKLYYHVTCGINNLHYYDLKNLVSYCYIHDPLKQNKTGCNINTDSYTKLTALLVEDKRDYNYRTLKYRPEIREKIEIQNLKESFILKIKHIKPRFTDFMANRIQASDLCSFNDTLITKYLHDIGSFFNVKNNRFYDPGDLLSTKERKWVEWNKTRNIICIKSSNIDFDYNNILKRCLHTTKDAIQTHENKIDNINKENVHNDNMNKENKIIDVKHIKCIYDNVNRIVKKLGKNPKKIYKPEIKYKREIHKHFIDIFNNSCERNHYKEISIDTITNIYNSLKALRIVIQKLMELENAMFNRLKLHKKTIDLTYNKQFFCMLNIINILKDNLNLACFIEPVTDKIAPYYSKIITEPMCFEIIEQKIENFNYNFNQFIQDVNLIIFNCRKYNYNNKFFLNLSDELEKSFNDLLKEYNEYNP